MKITLLAIGTRGDAQPAIALGKALKAAGYEVRVLASKNFSAWIESHGLEAAATSVDIHAMMNSEDGRQWVESGNNAVRELNVMKRLMNDLGFEMSRDMWNACQGVDAVIGSFTSDAPVLSIAEKTGIRHLRAMLQPMMPTRDGRCFANLPFPNSVNWFNLQVSKFALNLIWSVFEQTTNRFRREILALPELDSKRYYAALNRVPVVHGFSEDVIPRAADWEAHVQTAGYWFLDEDADWQPPANLVDFLGSGERPVVIGFGSMTGRNPEQTTSLVLDAIKRSGRRAVILSGWAGVGQSDLPDNVLKLEAAPHGWLLPKAAAVVHHGGAGTTAAGLRAGVPSILIPHFADQPLWAARVQALGVGPKPIARSKLNSERLAQAIQTAVSGAGIQRRAADLGEKIRAEDGLGKAVKFIQRYLEPDAG